MIRFSDAASADVFSHSLFEGFASLNFHFCNINIPPIGYFPKLSRVVWIPGFEGVEHGVPVKSIGMLSLPFIQDLSIRNRIYQMIKRLPLKEDVVFLVYAITPPVLDALLKYRRNISSRCRIVLIIPDFIEDMYEGPSIRSRIRRAMAGDIHGLYQEMDGFVYLTEKMKEITESDKPYRVVEGIYNLNEVYIEPNYELDEKVVFYSGKLQGKFGIKRLVDAFLQISDPSFKLVLCGSGDTEEYIQMKAAEDKRIVFCGQISREQVLFEQAKATLLVNPRIPEGSYTRYSFPSKNIQYMASGIPMLAYALPGVPESYHRYGVFIPEDDLSIERLSYEIIRMCNWDPHKRRQFGQAAREYILNEKNACVQCEKILDLLKEIH
jgi:glycosyltransferase involved in cell wall biosynthesis